MQPNLFLKFLWNSSSCHLVVLMSTYTFMVINISLSLKFINIFSIWTPYFEWTPIECTFYLYSSSLILDKPHIISLYYIYLITASLNCSMVLNVIPLQNLTSFMPFEDWKKSLPPCKLTNLMVMTWFRCFKFTLIMVITIVPNLLFNFIHWSSSAWFYNLILR